MYKVKFADIGEGLTEGKVAEVLVKVGDLVKEGDSLFFVETDKVNSEIPAPVGGKIAKIFIKPDQEIKVGEVVMEIEETQSASEKKPAKQTSKKVNPEKVEEENASVVGSTPVSDEVIKPNAAQTTSDSASVNETNLKVKATPLARKMAQDLKIDLTKITPTGPGQRILVADLKQAPQNGVNVSSPTPKIGVGSPTINLSNLKIPALTFNNPQIQWEFESKPMHGIRKATVKAMTFSHQTNAGFTGLKNIDLTSTVNLRAQIKSVVEPKGIKLTYLAFIIKAVVKSLQEMPNLNVQIDEQNHAIKYLKNINIGVAVDTSEGLIVPVIKQADRLSVLEIAVAINELATKAKNKKLTLKDISEATFTVTNFGSVGLEFATPIINAPEAAILGVGAMSKQLVYVDGEIQSRMLMPFSLTADHRIIDGADVGRFLQKMEAYLKQPELLWD